MSIADYPNRYNDVPAMSQMKSVASIVAILSAIASFYFAAQGREFLGLFAAIVAIGAGFLGAARALSPRVSGGILSIAAIIMGALAIIVSLIALVV